LIFKKRTGFRESLQPANWHELGKKGREGEGNRRRADQKNEERPKGAPKISVKMWSQGGDSRAKENSKQERKTIKKRRGRWEI
jgi:hypothetical protein